MLRQVSGPRDINPVQRRGDQYDRGVRQANTRHPTRKPFVKTGSPFNYRLLVAALIAVIIGLIIGLVLTSGNDDSPTTVDSITDTVVEPTQTQTVPTQTQTQTTPTSTDGGVSPPPGNGGTPAPGSGSGSGLNP